MKKNNDSDIPETELKIKKSLKEKEIWSLLFFPLSFIYSEIVFKAMTYKKFDIEILFILLLSVSTGLLFYLLSILSKNSSFNRIIAAVLSGVTGIWFGAQYVYYNIFNVPLSVISVSAGTGQIAEDNNFTSFAVLKIYQCLPGIIILLLPFIILIICVIFLRKKANIFNSVKNKKRALTALSFIISYAACLAVVFGSSFTANGHDDDKIFGQYFTSSFNVTLSQPKFGVLTNCRLDIQHIFFKYYSKASKGLIEYNNNSKNGNSSENEVMVHEETGQATDTSPNIMNIDFDSLIKSESNDDIIAMHKYFSSVTPTNKNEYTGIYKNYNLIYMVCESFSHLAISQELTPTLYKLANEGVVFKNAYDPLWGVSTTDGEYVACQSLIPESGVWSFLTSKNNYIPFALGNMFLKNYNCTPRAYHDHTYNYYHRELSHPNLGYVYEGVGNGLEITKSWPESDLEMMQATIGDYINDDVFHAYYMTVSGHMQYDFSKNYIALKNKSYVENLDYSEQAKAYLAASIELDKALEYLIDQLDKAGKLENTVIVMCADHYPYGLSADSMNELAGHKIDTDFEIYKNQIIIWNANQKKTVIETPVSNMDILPTILNMFGFEYDSRLLMGRDVFGGGIPLVIFNDRSFITDKVFYNAKTGKAESINGDEISDEYLNGIKNIVSNRFYYSSKILDNDYYRYLFPDS